MGKAASVEILDRLVDVVAAMEPGSSSSVSLLVAELFPGADLGFRELFDIDSRLRDSCEDRGILLDTIHHYGMVEGPPSNLDFTVRRIVNGRGAPVSYDEVDGAMLTMCGYAAGRWESEDFVVLRDSDGTLGWRADMGQAARSRLRMMPYGEVRARDAALLRKALEEVDVRRWERGYSDSRIIDGTQWSFQLNLADGGAVVSSGSNAYPPGFDVLRSALAQAVTRGPARVASAARVIAESPNRSRQSLRRVYRKAFGAEPEEVDLPGLLEELEAECAHMGIALDFSEWNGLCVGPRHNQSFVVRKSALYYARRALRGLRLIGTIWR